MGQDDDSGMRYWMSRKVKRLIAATLSALAAAGIGIALQAAVEPMLAPQAAPCTVYPAELVPGYPELAR